jgi:hypothetical protein
MGKESVRDLQRQERERAASKLDLARKAARRTEAAAKASAPKKSKPAKS